MMKLALLKGLRCLVVLPAVLVLGVSLVLADDARGQMSPGEPLVLIANDAAAFAAAMGPDIPGPPEAFSTDIVVVVPMMPASANLILIDIRAKRKIWTLIAPQRLREILSRMGEPV